MPFFALTCSINLFVILVSLLFCVAASAAAQPTASKPIFRPVQVSSVAGSVGALDDRSFSRDLLDAVLTFRQLGLRNHQEALSRFGTESVSRKFAQFNKSVFLTTDATNSWSFFFNTSVYAFGALDSPRHVVAFYHPWCDVFLLLDWEKKNGRFWVTDAEIVLGDWIRNEKPASMNPVPSWLEKTTFGPLSLGISVGQTIAAFEKRFAKKSSGGFRERLPSLNKGQALNEPNYRLAASRLLYMILKIEVLGEQVETEGRLSDLWMETFRIVDQAAVGDWEALFKVAHKTLPTTKYVLKKLPSEKFRDLVIVDYYVEHQGWLVFLAPVFDAGFCFSLSFEPDENHHMHMKRIDFISFPVFYDHTVKREKQS
jgi:hypothetical protein